MPCNRGAPIQNLMYFGCHNPSFRTIWLNTCYFGLKDNLLWFLEDLISCELVGGMPCLGFPGVDMLQAGVHQGTKIFEILYHFKSELC